MGTKHSSAHYDEIFLLSLALVTMSARRIGIVVAHGVGEGGRIIISDRDTGANFI